MPQIDPVILQLRAELTSYKNELRATTTLVSRSLAQQEASVTRLETQIERSSGRMAAALSGLRSNLAGLAAGVSLTALAREFLSISDTAKTLDAQLRLATAGFGSFTQAQEDVRRLASDTRSSLEATTKLYGGFSRAAAETGRSQEDAARATQTFVQALKIGGAGTAEAESATLQFNQALQSGVLRGDEFNSIMEASPRVARLLADALGEPIGKLREMAEDGKITSDVLYRALTDRRFTDGIDAEFRELPVTFGDAMQAVKNSAIITFGAFDQGGEFSNALVNFLGTGTDTFEGLEQGAQDLGIEIRAALDGLGDVFDPMLDGGNAVFDALGIRVFSLREQISSLLGSIDSVRNFLPNLQRSAQRFDERLLGFRTGPYTGDAAPLANSQKVFDQSFAASERRAQQRIRDRRADDLLDDFLGEFDAPRSAPRSTGTTKKTGRTSAPRAQRSPLDPEAFAREEAQLNQAILREKAGQAQTAEEIADFEIQRIASAKAQYEAETKADKRFTEPQKARLIALNDLVSATEQAAAIRKRDVEIEQRASDAIRRQYETGDAATQNRIDEERARLDLARTVDERRAIELRVLELAQAQERAEQEHLIALQRRVLADRNSTPEARAEAEAQIARAEGRLATLARTQPAERQAVQERNAGPLATYLRSFDDPATQVELAVVDKLQSVDDAITDAAAKTLGVKDPVLRSLLQIFLQQNVLKPLYEAFSKNSGGGVGGLLASIGSALGFGGGGGDLNSLLAQGNGAPPPIPLGLAGGGSMRIAGNPGLDRNTLSINGQPVARVNRGETLHVTPQARATRGGGTITVHVQASPYFDARVAQVSGPIAQGVSVEVMKAAAPQIAQTGANQAMVQMASQQRYATYNRLPGTTR